MSPKPRRPDYKRKEREKAKRLYLVEGKSTVQIGKELGVSTERARQYLNELGVRRRPPGRRYERG